MVRVLIRTTIAAVLIIFCTAVHAETDTETVKGPEMMADAIAKLEAIYDLPITYDELIIPYQEKELPTVKFPDGLSFTYEPVPADISMEDRKQLAAKKIKEVLDRYSSAYGKEMYVMHEGNGGFHVVQIRYANKSGEVVSYTPVLDAPISLEAKTRTPEEAVSKICEEASKASGQTLQFLPCGVAACGNGWYSQHETNIGASNETARDVLDRVLAQMLITAEKPCPGQTGCFRDVSGHLSWRVRWSGMLYPHLIAPPGMVGGQNTMDKPFLNAPEHTLTVEGERPIIKAIDQLEEIYGIPISYEDPPHVPGTESVVDKAGRKLKIDTISITYGVPPENAPIETRRTLAGKALSELMIYVQRHSTQYIIVNGGSTSFEVGPQFVLGDGGKVIQEHSFLIWPISISKKDRTAYEILEEIFRSISEEEGRTLHIGQLPEDLFKNHHINFWAFNEPAMSVLDRLLKEMAPQPSKSSDLEALHFGSVSAPLSWRIFCKPDNDKDCSINFHTVVTK